MFCLALFALASITFSANSLVIPRSDNPPAGYAEGYLEPYHTYNVRYMALGCDDKHNTQFFTDCCHPMLATENLKDNRKPYCTPSQQALASAAQDPDPSTVTPHASFPTPPPASATPSPTIAAPKTLAASPAVAPPPKNVAPPPPPPPPPAPSPPPPSPGLSGTGIATFFYQNGIAGACGTVHKDSDFVVALQTETYANGAHCGKQIKLTDTATGVTAIGIVADECPTCGKKTDCDLSTGLFSQFAPFAQGIFPLEWEILGS